MLSSSVFPHVSGHAETIERLTAPGRHVRAIAALSLVVTLGACMGNLFEARPVCIKPHGGANYQLAPKYQCEAQMQGRKWVNR